MRRVNFSVAAQEMKWQWSPQIKVDDHQDTAFSTQNFFNCVCLIRHVVKFVNVRAVTFFKLGRNKQACYANQLNLLSSNRRLTLNTQKKQLINIISQINKQTKMQYLKIKIHHCNSKIQGFL